MMLDSDRIAENSLFVSVMTDLTSRVPIGGEDPRWIQLFSIDILPDLVVSPASLMEYCERWTKTNPVTKNFLHFLEQVSSRIRYLQRKGSINSDSIYEACLGLYIATVTFQYFIGNLSMDEVRVQLLLPLPWPEYIDEKKDFRLKRSGIFHVVENLIYDCIVTVGAINVELNDVKFFCIELLICLLSPSLYKHHQVPSPEQITSPPPMSVDSQSQSVSANHNHIDSDIFRHYLTKIAHGDLQFTLSHGGFSDSAAVRVAKGLMLNVIGVVASSQSTSSSVASYFGMFGGTYSGNPGEGVLLTKLQAKLKSHLVNDASNMSANTAQNVGNYLSSWISFGTNKTHTSDVLPVVITNQSYLQNQTFPKYLLAERSTQLLLLLLHQQPQQVDEHQSVSPVNPFREVFSLLTDESLDRDEEGEGELDTMIGLLSNKGPSTTASLHIQRLHLHFSSLFEYFIEFLPNANAMLLLYSFLTQHPTFLEFLRITGNTNKLLLKCLQNIYHLTDPVTINAMLSSAATSSFASSSLLLDLQHHLIITVHCVFYILQDFTLCHHSNPALLQTIQIPAWLTNFITKKNQIKVIEVTIVVLLRGLKAALYSLQDKDLIRYLLITLKYLFPSIEGLQSRTAESLVKTLLSCLRRLAKMYAKEMGLSSSHETLFRSSSEVSVMFDPLSRTRTNSISEFPQAYNDPSHTPSYLGLLSLVVRDLLVMVSSIVRLKLPQNSQLLYGLIMEKEQLEWFLSSENDTQKSRNNNSNNSNRSPVPLSVILLNYTQDPLYRTLLASDDPGDMHVDEHIQYILHLVVFYAHAMERTKELQQREEYRTSEEAMLQLEILIEQFNPSNKPDNMISEQAEEYYDEEEHALLPSAFPTVPPLANYYPSLLFDLNEEIGWYKQHYFMAATRECKVAFLLSDIWTNILLSSPEFPWRWNKLSVSSISR